MYDTEHIKTIIVLYNFFKTIEVLVEFAKTNNVWFSFLLVVQKSDSKPSMWNKNIIVSTFMAVI